MNETKKYTKPFNLDDKPMSEVIRKVAEIEAKPQSAKENNDVAFEGQCQMTLFNDKEIRKVFHNNEWYFSIIDVIEAVVETDRPSKYWNDIKRQIAEKEGAVEFSESIGKLNMPGIDGRMYPTDAVNVETLFRIIQSVPSPKAEPFKRWLAKVGYERIEEFQNPEIAVKRAILNWQIQGRKDDWIEARLRSIVVRHELTSEWSKRGIKVGMEYGYLTNIISKETFGLKTSDHKKFKGLKSHNLRDHMTDFELVLTMLGEKSTAAIAQTSDAQGLNENAVAARSGGRVAGNARKELETTLQRSIVSKDNFLKNKTNKKKLPLRGCLVNRLSEVFRIKLVYEKNIPKRLNR